MDGMNHKVKAGSSNEKKLFNVNQLFKHSGKIIFAQNTFD
jgi:hypothetical protein